MANNIIDNQFERMRYLMGYKSSCSVNENKKSVDPLEYKKLGPDGNYYGIVREGSNYVIKTAKTNGVKKEVVKEDFDYIGGYMQKGRNTYPSYAAALKAFQGKMASLQEAFDANAVLVECIGKTEKVLIESQDENIRNDIKRQLQIMNNAQTLDEKKMFNSLNESSKIGNQGCSTVFCKAAKEEGVDSKTGEPKETANTGCDESGCGKDCFKDMKGANPTKNMKHDSKPIIGKLKEAKDEEEDPIDDEEDDVETSETIDDNSEEDNFGADDEEGEDNFGADDEEGDEEFGDDEFGADDEEGDDEFGVDDEEDDEFEDDEHRTFRVPRTVTTIEIVLDDDDEDSFEDDDLFGMEDDECGVGMPQMESYRRGRKVVSEEGHRLNVWGKHPRYRKQPTRINPNTEAGINGAEDWNDESVRNERPYGEDCQPNAFPFKIHATDTLENSIAENRNFKKKRH